MMSPELVLRESAGFPTSNRELARRRPNTNDPNNFYRLLGVPPWADERAVKKAGRTLLRRYHTDGESPDRERFEEIQRAYRILTNSRSRVEYDATPPGFVYLTPEALSVMFDTLGSPQAVKDKLFTPPANWSYYEYGPGERPEDGTLAGAWYDELLAAAWCSGYRGRVQLIFSEVTHPFFSNGRACVPRISPNPYMIHALIGAWRHTS